jgi:hypothetical protein
MKNKQIKNEEISKLTIPKSDEEISKLIIPEPEEKYKNIIIEKICDSYLGNYKNEKFDGQGTLYCINEDIYMGIFKDGKLDGNGAVRLANGDVYIGFFKDKKCKVRYSNKKKYEGNFEKEKEMIKNLNELWKNHYHKK